MDWFLNDNGLRHERVMERNCLRDKFSRFSRIFDKFAILNPREKSTGSQFAKLNPREKKNFFPFFRISKTFIFTLGSLPINDGWSCQKYFTGYQQSRIKSFLSKSCYLKYRKNWQVFCDSHTTSWKTNHKKIKIYKSLIKLIAKINPHEANSRN